jgi:hypothetical protein
MTKIEDRIKTAQAYEEIDAYLWNAHRDHTGLLTAVREKMARAIVQLILDDGVFRFRWGPSGPEGSPVRASLTLAVLPPDDIAHALEQQAEAYRRGLDDALEAINNSRKSWRKAGRMSPGEVLDNAADDITKLAENSRKLGT